MKPYILVIFLLCLIGCDADQPLGPLFDSPEITYTIVSKTNKTPGSFAEIEVEFFNRGSSIAYGVRGVVSIYKGSTVIETKHLYISRIKVNESALDEVWLTKIDNHNEYTRYTIEVSWKDGSGYYYD